MSIDSQPPAARADGPAPPKVIGRLHEYAEALDRANAHGDMSLSMVHSYAADTMCVAADALTAALAEVATLKQENQRLKAEIQTETCPSCGEVCPAGWCGVCHVPIMTDWEKGFQRICEVAAQNLARAEQAEAEVTTLHQAHQWQPIETAPTDGTNVLLWWPFWCKGRPTIGWFGYKGIGQWVCPEALEGDGDPPTHWMPLPAAPDPAGLARRAARPQPQQTEEETKDV